MKFIDVSVPLDANLPTYPGNTPFRLEPLKRIAEGGSSNVTALHLSAHTGTHIDAPRHFFDDGPGVESIPLDLLCGRTRVIELATRQGITAADFAGIDLADDVRVLLKTHNSTFWGSPTFHTEFIGLAESGARYLLDHGIKVVGVDYLSVEPFKTPGAPTHHALLGSGVVVIEGLNLRAVEAGVYEMFCLPLLAVGVDGAPARVVLRRT
jgi:arylformamidase